MQNVFSEFDVSFRCQLFNFALKINGLTHCSLNKLPRKNTAVAPKKSNKEDLIVLAISPQNNMDSSNDKVLEEVNTLNQKLETLESDTTKNTNTLLSRQLVELEGSILSILREIFCADWSTQVTFKRGSQNERLRFGFRNCDAKI